MFRRVFLQTSAAAIVLPTLPNVSLADSAPKGIKLRLGLVTYNWGKAWDVPTIIKNCAETRFEGVELRSTHQHGVEIDLPQAKRKEVRQRFDDSEVELVGLGSACEYHAADQSVVEKNIKETKAFVRLCHDVGGTGVKVRPNGLPKDVPVEKTLAQIAKNLNIVGKDAADFGIQIRVEVHGHGTSEIAHMKAIMDQVDEPNVVVCWNCNQTDLKGAGLKQNYESLQSKMGTIHIHDLTNNAYPWQELFPLLKRTEAPSFTGWCLLEDGKVPKDIVASMHKNRTEWERLIAQK